MASEKASPQKAALREMVSGYSNMIIIIRELITAGTDILKKACIPVIDR